MNLSGLKRTDNNTDFPFRHQFFTIGADCGTRRGSLRPRTKVPFPFPEKAAHSENERLQAWSKKQGRRGERKYGISFELESRHQVNLKTLDPVDRVISLLKDGAQLQERMR